MCYTVDPVIFNLQISLSLLKYINSLPSTQTQTHTYCDSLPPSFLLQKAPPLSNPSCLLLLRTLNSEFHPHHWLLPFR